MTDEKENPVADFVASLGRLGPGDRAKLKRNAGNPLAESRNALGVFFSLLPDGVPQWQHETYFVLATLFPLAEAGAAGDFGASLRQASTATTAKGLDRRVERLLDAEGEQLSFRLRQAVRFLASKEVRVNWFRLLDDLLHWSHPDRFVQKRWARSYFAG